MKRRTADIESQQRAIEFYQEENARLMERIDSLLERIDILQARLDKKDECENNAVAVLREAFEKQLREQKESYEKQLADMSAKMDHMAEANAGLASQISDLMATASRHRSKRFAPSTEKRDLLNSKPESRAQKEEECDGSKDDDDRGGSGSTTAAATEKPAPKARKPSRRNPEPDGEAHYDNVIDHYEEEDPIPENAHVVEGADGSLYFDVVTVTPARVVCHRYHYRRYVAKNPDTLEEKFGDTLPEEVKAQRAAPRCVLSVALMAFILTQKYAYHLPKKRVRMMLRDMGAHIPKNTFYRFYEQGEDRMLSLLGTAWRAELLNGRYFMVDETVETVGVDDKELGRHYLSKYLWEFYNRDRNIVEYVYDDGSRGQKVLTDVFTDKAKLMDLIISCDGYNAYQLFDSEEYPNVKVAGCWTHARRYIVESRESCTAICDHLLDLIGSLFATEQECREAGMNEDSRLAYRKVKSAPTIAKIKALVDQYATDAGLMAISAFRKAVTYIRNQWAHLSTFLESGIPEISNNLSEQRVRPIKLSLKNCQNVGSPDAARRQAFLHSIAETCRINGVVIQGYLEMAFSKARSAIDDVARRLLLPHVWRPEC